MADPTTFDNLKATLKAVIQPPEPTASLVPGTGTDLVTWALTGMIDAFPPLGNDGFVVSSFRETLAMTLECALPTCSIAGPPDQGHYDYSYNGSQQNYNEVFFPRASTQPNIPFVIDAMGKAVATINDGWWGNFAVAVLTDAIRQQVPSVAESINGQKLENVLASFNSIMAPALTAGYVIIFIQGGHKIDYYLAQMDGNAQAQASAILEAAIGNGAFTAAINGSINSSPWDAPSVTWLLYNLWVTLYAFNGLGDISSRIAGFIAKGLQVPPQLGPWCWQKEYTSWFWPALGAADVLQDALPGISLDMPVKQTYKTKVISTSEVSLSNGFAQSFALWSKFNNFKH